LARESARRTDSGADRRQTECGDVTHNVLQNEHKGTL
jgi:hypothetical protein